MRAPVLRLLFVLPLMMTGAARADDCPHAVLFEPAGTGSHVDSGWTGLNHQKPIIGDRLPLAVSCAATTPPCGVCTVTGILPDGGGTLLRCTNDTSVACTVATEVADCGGPDTCHYFLHPPQATAVSGVTACYTNEVTGGVTGSVDSGAGDLSVAIPYLGTLFSGGSPPDACPRCVGDPTLDDGVRGGTCSAGGRMGLPCDATALTPAPFDGFGATSLDCPAAGFISVSIPGPLALSTQSQTRSLTAASPTCKQTGFTSFSCFCDTCNDLAGEPCTSNADCPISGGNPGICGGRRCIGGANAGTPCGASSECPAGVCDRLGEKTQPNACQDDTGTPANEAVVCIDTAPVGDGEGQCPGGPLNAHCAARPYSSCVTDPDCGVFGPCVLENQSCFLDNGMIGGSVTFTGTASPPVDDVSDPTVLGTLFCQVPSASSAVNATVGFPGLARQQHSGSLTYAEDVVARLVGAGESATTVGAGAPNDVETTVTTPTGGALTIVSTLHGAPPAGFNGLGHLVQTEAPSATVPNPLAFTFEIAAAAIPGTETATDVEVFKDGAGPAPNCVDATTVPNDPCVASRTTLGGGNVQVTVLSTTAGDWTLGYQPGPATCPPTPDGCLGPTASRAASLTVNDRTPDSKDRLNWRWAKGAAATKADFGDPLASDTYALCVYDVTGRRATLRIPFGGTCAGKPCWSDKSQGFLYRDRDATAAGVTKVALKAGDAGKSGVQVQGKGDLLPIPPPLSLTPPLQLQLRNVTSGLCWGATFSAPLDKVDAKILKDKSD